MTGLLFVCAFLCLQYLKRNRSFKQIFMGIIVNGDSGVAMATVLHVLILVSF